MCTFSEVSIGHPRLKGSEKIQSGHTHHTNKLCIDCRLLLLQINITKVIPLLHSPGCEKHTSTAGFLYDTLIISFQTQPHWKSTGLPEISREPWQVCVILTGCCPWWRDIGKNSFKMRRGRRKIAKQRSVHDKAHLAVPGGISYWQSIKDPKPKCFVSFHRLPTEAHITVTRW